MSGDAPVRICEGLEVKFLWSTHLKSDLSINSGDTFAGQFWISFEFERENAIYFSAVENTTYIIDNQIELRKILTERLKSKSWESNWLIITELIKSENTILFISNKAGSKIEFSTNLDFDLNAMNKILTSNESKMVFHKGINTKIVSKGTLSPLFKVKGLRKHIFNVPTFDSKNPDNNNSLNPDNVGFEEIKLC